MRTALRLFALLLATSVAGTAFAREIDETGSNTSLSAAPMGTTSASMRAMRQGKKEQTVPAKYDVAYPVHDTARPMHPRGAI
jgi:hypothetical protein